MRAKEQAVRDQYAKQKQPTVTEQVAGQATPTGLPGNVVGSVGDTSIQACAARLRDARFGIAQRRALGRQLGRLGGNRYLQRLLVQMAPDVTKPLNTTGVVDVPITTIRERPDEASKGIARVRKDVILPVKAKITKADGKVWYKVEYRGKEGFVFFWDLGVGASPAQSTAAPPANDWMNIIPDAVPRTGRPLRPVAGGNIAHGELVTFANFAITYRPNPTRPRQELATAGPLPTPDVTQDQVNQSVAAIKKARGAIHERLLIKRDRIPSAGTGFSTPTGGERQKIKAAKNQKLLPDVETTERYLDWLDLADTRPTLVSNSRDIRWLVFKRIFPMEGDPSAVMTYDQTNITWGVGFSGHGGTGSGQTEDMMVRLFNQSADAAAIFWEVGLTVVGDRPVVVDTDRGWKLHGQDAELYIRANKQILSLMVNITQGEFIAPYEASLQDIVSRHGIPSRGEQLRQKVLDAQFETFLTKTLRGQNLSNWGVDAAAQAAHAVHSDKFSWSEFTDDLPANVRHIKDKLTKTGQLYLFPGIVPYEWRGYAP